MTPSEELEYLKQSLQKWEEIIENQANDIFKKFIKTRIKAINEKVSSIKKKHPEALLIKNT